MDCKYASTRFFGKEHVFSFLFAVADDDDFETENVEGMPLNLDDG